MECSSIQPLLPMKIQNACSVMPFVPSALDPQSTSVRTVWTIICCITRTLVPPVTLSQTASPVHPLKAVPNVPMDSSTSQEVLAQAVIPTVCYVMESTIHSVPNVQLVTSSSFLTSQRRACHSVNMVSLEMPSQTPPIPSALYVRQDVCSAVMPILVPSATMDST